MSSTLSGIIAICSLVIALLSFFLPYRLTFKKTYAKIKLRVMPDSYFNERSIILKYSPTMRCFYLFIHARVENGYPTDGVIFNPSLNFNNDTLYPLFGKKLKALPTEIKEVRKNFFSKTPIFNDKLVVEKQAQTYVNLLFKLPRIDFSFGEFSACLSYEQYRNKHRVEKYNFTFEIPGNLYNSDEFRIIFEDLRLIEQEEIERQKIPGPSEAEILKIINS